MQIVPMREDYIDGFHGALDFVARERRYLAFLEAPPIAEVRRFVRSIIKCGYPQYVAISTDEVVGWCDVIPMDGRSMLIPAFSEWGFCHPSEGAGSARI